MNVDIYKRKSEYVEAIRFDDEVDTLAQISEFTNGDIAVDYRGSYKLLKVFTEFGKIAIEPGDYLCRRADGKLFGLGSGMFDILYEKAHR